MKTNDYLGEVDPLTLKKINEVLSNVFDPEIPVLSIIDLGILRNIKWENGILVVEITPTYNGCPAMNVIEWNIQAALEEAGIEQGKIKLQEYGIAPPQTKARIRKMFDSEESIICPRCLSNQTRLVSEYGSTACKSMYQCKACLEPFDYFKCH